MSAVIDKRYEFVYLFDVENGNPNGDPDAGNMPRIDPETSFGIVTDVCLKRKVRNFVDIVKDNESPYKIYVRDKGVLSTERSGAYEGLSKEEQDDKLSAIEQGRQFMCKNYYDVRSFGAVMATKTNNCGQVRGPVQFNFAKSIESIVPLDITITRMAVETEAEREKERMMGRKHIVPYALYRAEGYISAFFAQKTGFTQDDLELLWQALINMFDHDHSAARGKMNARKLIIFEHDSALGSAPAHKLFDLVSVKRIDQSDTAPARSFADYTVTIDDTAVPSGVRCIDKL